MLVSLARITLGTGDSALAMMGDLAAIRATLVRTTTGGAGASRDGDDCAGVDNRTAAGCKGIRTGPLDANTSFMYNNSAHSHMNDAVKPGFTYLCCEGRASCNTVHLTILTRLRKSTRRVRPRRRGRKL
jgi:hypothetical protein